MEPSIKYIPEGIPNLKPLFPNINFDNIEQWFVVANQTDTNDAESAQRSLTVATTRVNQIGCCCNDEKLRIHFINSLGEIDSINFGRAEEVEDIKSDSWTKSLGFPFEREKGGSRRHNITSNETIEAETKCYGEDDQYWISELFKSPMAWLEMKMPQGFNESINKEYVPIEILDNKFIKKKVEKRYEYLVKIKFSMSNANINLR